jgi:hypothetical protein
MPCCCAGFQALAGCPAYYYRNHRCNHAHYFAQYHLHGSSRESQFVGCARVLRPAQTSLCLCVCVCVCVCVCAGARTHARRAPPQTAFLARVPALSACKKDLPELYWYPLTPPTDNIYARNRGYDVFCTAEAALTDNAAKLAANPKGAITIGNFALRMESESNATYGWDHDVRQALRRTHVPRTVTHSRHALVFRR